MAAASARSSTRPAKRSSSNSGYAYPTSQHAEDIFTHKIDGHTLLRFANLTLDMFQ